MEITIYVFVFLMFPYVYYQDSNAVVVKVVFHITEIKTGKVYSYKVKEKAYIIYIKTKDKIPIAYRLEIKKII